jgi:hypothetical protein
MDGKFLEPYPLSEVEKDIRPEDFPEGSVWNKLVKHCGPASLLILADYKITVADSLPIRDKKGFVRKALNRYLEKLKQAFTP